MLRGGLDGSRPWLEVAFRAAEMASRVAASGEGSSARFEGLLVGMGPNGLEEPGTNCLLLKIELSTSMSEGDAS